MAVAAYASLVSLTHVLDNLHYRAPFQLPCLDKKQIETLQENVQSLLEFVEHHSKRKCPKIEDLWSQMTEVAFLAEETIDFHVVNLLHKRSQGETSDDTELSAVCEDMKRLISNTHYIKQELPAASIEKEEDEEAEEEEVEVGKQRTASVPVNVSSGTSSSDKNVVVGFDKHVDRIMDVLTRRHELDLHILPIVGMGGMGKTTLARTVYDHKYIIDSFDRRLWITISQEYSTEQILRGLLDEGGNIGTSENSAKLGERLYKRLYGRRYLIVMDDVWTSKAWDELKMFFPNNGNGSRVLLTTRLSNVVDLPGSLNPHSLSFLDEHHSWDLFCRTTFGQIGCPYDELAQIGRHIAKKCRGLPLAIVVIGRLLASSNTTREYWEFVAKNMNSLANLGDDERCLKILQLSYENLSIHLKPCFLYMRVFPEDAKVEISRLISLWIAEGYIKLVSNKSMEETAHEYFKELIDRNLIFINMSKREYCGIHDLLRDVCFRESNKECFLRSPKVQYINRGFRSGRCFLCEKRLTKKEREDLPKPVNIFPSSSLLSRCVCNACETLYSHRRKPRFVRTLDCIGKDKTEIVQPLIKRRSRFEKTIVQPLGLRYWYVSIVVFYQLKYVSISRVHLLWNLQTMKLSSTELDPIVLPPEIWEMPQLRVVDVSYKVLLPNPVGRHIEGENQDFIVLKNLHTLSSVQNFKCTKEILDRIPNLKELEIGFRYKSQGVSSESLNFFLYNLERLEKLEALDVTNALESIAFPNSLKRLGLFGCAVSWEEMSIVGSLPNLEELHMIQEGQGSEWSPVEGEFLKLRSLDLTSPDLLWWRADAIHFPVLEELQLRDLNLLEEIPSGIGDIPTLQSITLEKCNDSVINSGKQIWEEQQDMGNEDLKLYIGSKQYEISATKPNDSDS